MTGEERDVLRMRIDEARRASFADRDEARARRRRIRAACCPGSPVNDESQVRLVERMLARRVPGGAW